MKQEDKDLVVIDLSARLPYGVIVAIKSSNHEDWDDWVGELTYKDLDFFDNDVIYDYVKPYLRPMSSMTEDEKHNYFMTYTSINGISVPHPYKTQDWLNKYHFDYRGLIPKGLALEAPEDMYKD